MKNEKFIGIIWNRKFFFLKKCFHKKCDSGCKGNNCYSYKEK